MSTPSHEVPLTIAGPAGELEARWRDPASTAPTRAVAVLCHPHPLFGGTLHNKILFRLAKRLACEAAVASLRFNFRGAGTSEGTHDDGHGEVADAQAACEAAAHHRPGLPLLVVGYSFGAAIGLRAAAADPRVGRLIALGTPLRAEWDLGFLRTTHKPRFFVQGEHDEFGPGTELLDFVGSLDGVVAAHVIAGADHLFNGVEDEAVTAVIEYIRAHC